MFESARIKLTAWYLLIIMLISIFFSLAFYNAATREIRRVIRVQEFRSANTLLLPIPAQRIKDVEESEERLRLILFLINGGIFFLAGGAGYFLAGRTLRPIKIMVDDQNRFITDASHELRTPLTSLRSEIEEFAVREKRQDRK